MNENSKEIQ